MPDDNHLIKNFGLKAGCVWTISFVLFVIGIYEDFHTKSIWIIILFLIPFAVQFRGLYILYRRYDEQNIANAVFSDFYLITMAICLMSYSIFWLSYINWKNKFKWEDELTWKIEDNTAVFLIYSLSIVALVVILILLLLVVRMTRAVIQGDGSKIPVHSSVFGETKRKRGDIWNLDYLRAGASQEPFYP